MYLRAYEFGARGRGWYWLAVAVFVCALLSKSMVVNLPVVLLILDVYPLRRLGGAIGWWSEPARRVYVEKIPFVLLATAAAAIAVMAQLSVHAAASLAQLSVPGRVAVSAYGLSFYLWKMVVPLNLSPLYPLSPIVNPWAMPFVLSYTMVLAITAIALALRRRVPGLPAAWSAYVVVLLPVLGIFQSGPQIAADRYTYLASLGWAILAGACLLYRLQALPYVSSPGWEFSLGTRSRSGMTPRGCGPIPLQFTPTLPSLSSASALCLVRRASRPRRSSTSRRAYNSDLTSPPLTRTWASRSSSRASWPTRSSTSARPCASILTTPSPTPTGARHSLTWASRARRSSTSSRPCVSILTMPSPTPTGARHSLTWASRARRSSTTARLCASRLALPKPRTAWARRSLKSRGSKAKKRNSLERRD